MAEGGYTNRRPKAQQICRYFVHGACDRGDSCRFLHDRTGTAPANNICKFYQQGHCSYGNRCRYEHVRKQKPCDHDTSNSSNSKSKKEKRQQHSEQSQSKPTCLHGCRHRSDDDWESSLVPLRRGGGHNANNSPSDSSIRNQVYTNKKKPQQEGYQKKWANAKDFVPGQKFHAGATYARISRDSEGENTANNTTALTSDPKEEDLLCPYFAHGHCPYEDACSYIHGEVCDICQLPRLHPKDEAQREQHTKECLSEMEKDMEHSFAIQESKQKECCICMEVVLEKGDKEIQGAASRPKASSDAQFGILENCNHCFCLSCIRRWRSDKSFGKNVRVCPICRVHSDFVTPSSVWVEDETAKKKVIQDYKDALGNKPCQYFKQGKGECPFNEKCFYRHAYPDGTIAKPQPRKKKRRQVDSNGELSMMETISLWDFIEGRDDGFISLEDGLSLYLLGMLQDSDDDDDLLFFSDVSSTTSSDDFFL